ncbi:MAG TPA: NAD(P)/FAD-dependent oxidoreductase, partial [Myxococcota bacterium]
MSDTYDTVIIGAGMGGLTVGSLLAKRGERVAMLEAHDVPGGCCHTFTMGDYRFCAAVHYIFSCGEGEPVHNLVTKLGLADEVTFERLDPEGYDHFSCPSEQLRFRIPNGLRKWCTRMCERFPDDAKSLRAFFDVICALAVDLDRIPDDRSIKNVARAVLASPRIVNVLRYRGYTLQRLFDEHHLSKRAQAILATQMGDVGLPPDRVSLFIWIALVARYGDGAHYPSEHFSTFIEKIAGVIADAPGCSLQLNTEVAEVRMERGRIAAVRTTDGREVRGARFICNTDPQWFVGAVGRAHFAPEFLQRVDTEYSASSFSVYLGVRGLDLRDHGFGNWNVWHYPQLDINDTYAAQHERHDLSNPWLFM